MTPKRQKQVNVMRDRITSSYKLAIARRNAEPPDTKDDRAEKDVAIKQWLRRHRVKKIKPAFASFVGWHDIDDYWVTGGV
jgi:hypothetical protein